MDSPGTLAFIVASGALLLMFVSIRALLKGRPVLAGFLYGALGTPIVLALIDENGEQLRPKVVAVKMVLSGLLWAGHAYWSARRSVGGKAR